MRASAPPRPEEPAVCIACMCAAGRAHRRRAPMLRVFQMRTPCPTCLGQTMRVAYLAWEHACERAAAAACGTCVQEVHCMCAARAPRHNCSCFLPNAHAVATKQREKAAPRQACHTHACVRARPRCWLPRVGLASCRVGMCARAAARCRCANLCLPAQAHTLCRPAPGRSRPRLHACA
jgi:hypothetical protein